MSLLDDARAAAAQPGQLCSVLKAEIAQPKQWAELCQAIRDHAIPAPALARVCREHGIEKLSAHTVMRHRQGQCIACQRRGLVW